MCFVAINFFQIFHNTFGSNFFSIFSASLLSDGSVSSASENRENFEFWVTELCN